MGGASVRCEYLDDLVAGRPVRADALTLVCVVSEILLILM